MKKRIETTTPGTGYKRTGILSLWLYGPIIEGQYDSQIIAAETCADAREIAGGDVLLLGRADAKLKKGVVLQTAVNDEEDRYQEQSDRLATWRGHFGSEGR